MARELTVSHPMQQTQGGTPQRATRAEVEARVRDAVERARDAEIQAREARRAVQQEIQAVAQERAAAAAEARAAQGGVPVPPPPTRIDIQDGRVIVSDGGGAVVAGGSGVGGIASRGEAVQYEPQIPPQVVDIAYAFFTMIAVVAIGVPIVRIFGRWLDRRGAAAPALPADVTARLDRIEQAVETVAVEVERISEGQRFTSRLMAELRQAPQLEGARVPERRS